jgi:hypothetical protein
MEEDKFIEEDKFLYRAITCRIIQNLITNHHGDVLKKKKKFGLN